MIFILQRKLNPYIDLPLYDSESENERLESINTEGETMQLLETEGHQVLLYAGQTSCKTHSLVLRNQVHIQVPSETTGGQMVVVGSISTLYLSLYCYYVLSFIVAIKVT